MHSVEKYSYFEAELQHTGVRTLTAGEAVFRNSSSEYRVSAFKITDDSYRVRFMPCMEGVWFYEITVGESALSGKFECTAASGQNHGPVRTNGFHFQYDDGTRYIPFGTTCYVWVNQLPKIQDETIETLKPAPFNKIRMGLFPKSMPYNNNDPEHYPFFKDADGNWDVTNPDPQFWENVDYRIGQLTELGIEADLILFHPYDRWGFAQLTQEDSMQYLRYCIARYGAFRNIWWSLANEYEMLYAKTLENWDEYGETLAKEDVYHHLISAHNIISPYPKRDWMTHCSIQSPEIDRIIFWKQEYGIPVIIDECGYEGNLVFNWGNLSAFEMVHRFWWSYCRDGFCTHGETFHRDDEVLWWAKGGRLYGESAPRIAFLKELLYSLPGDWSATNTAAGNPNLDGKDEAAIQYELYFQEMLSQAPEIDRIGFVGRVSPMTIEGDGYYLQYMGHQSAYAVPIVLPESENYRVEVIDIWDMTRTVTAEHVSGEVMVQLPQKEGIAVLATRM